MRNWHRLIGSKALTTTPIAEKEGENQEEEDEEEDPRKICAHLSKITWLSFA